MSDEHQAEVTPEQLKVGTGVLVIIAVILIAIGLGYTFGTGIGWLAIGVFILLWARSVMKGMRASK